MTAILLSMAAAWAGLAAISLTMDRHHRQAFDRPPSRLRAGGMATAGWMLLGLSAAAVVHGRGWGIGLASWICVLPLAGMVQAGLLAMIGPRTRPRAGQR